MSLQDVLKYLNGEYIEHEGQYRNQREVRERTNQIVFGYLEVEFCIQREAKKQRDDEANDSRTECGRASKRIVQDG